MSDTLAPTTALMESFMAGDMEGALGALAPDAVIHEPASLWYGGDWEGPEGFGEILGLIASKLDVEIRDYELIDGGEVAILKSAIAFTSRASGRSLEMPVVELHHVRDGRVVRMDVYYKDTAALLELAGETR